MKPDSLFLSISVSDKTAAEIDTDTEHLYINMIPKFKSIRVHVPNTDWSDWHAVEVKNIVKNNEK